MWAIAIIVIIILVILGLVFVFARPSKMPGLLKKKVSFARNQKRQELELSDDDDSFELDTLDPQDTLAPVSTGFGKLVSDSDRRKYVKRLKNNFVDYEKSLGEFYKHQMDEKSKYQDEFDINQFPDEKQMKGRTVNDIYDTQTKRNRRLGILKPTKKSIDNESELNGGPLRGSKMHGYNDDGSGHGTADFGDDFEI